MHTHRHTGLHCAVVAEGTVNGGRKWQVDKVCITSIYAHSSTSVWCLYLLLYGSGFLSSDGQDEWFKDWLTMVHCTICMTVFYIIQDAVNSYSLCHIVCVYPFN